MVLSTEWSQVEVVDLINDGSGLGFGIVGGRSTGVVIKSILPGGIADKDGRLQSGDHVLQIGDVHLRGFPAEQVAVVLRQAGIEVRMVVARPVDPSTVDFESCQYLAPIVPTKILTDPDELDRQLLQNGYATCFNFKGDRQSPLAERERSPVELSSAKSDPVNIGCDPDEKLEAVRKVKSADSRAITNCNNNEGNSINKNNNDNGYNYSSNTSTSKYESPDCQSPVSTSHIIVMPVDRDDDVIPDSKRFSVALTKNAFGLGITIAGYVCEREDLSGIFVKYLTEGSEAHRCRLIELNDRIIGVDGQPLHRLTNREAVKLLKETGELVNLTFERYLRGPKYDQLREVFASHDDEGVRAKSPPASPSVTTLSWIPIDNAEVISIERDDSVDSVHSGVYGVPENREIFIEEDFEANPEDDLETIIREKWEGTLGGGANIVVANLTKLKGLGISLEGTVDVEGGIELRPRHFIRSILPEGPVGQNGRLSPGDEILEVNGQKLLGLRHVDVVKILRELPNAVRLVCSRKNINDNRVINTSQDREAFEQRNILGGSLENLLERQRQRQQRLVKATSESSLRTTSSTATVSDESASSSLKKGKSRTSETTSVALWSDEVDYVDLRKAEGGLGFSILDYRDPVDPKSTLIVVRGLVPRGPADCDGRIAPGDRLISVNETPIKNNTLDEAVRALKGTLPGTVRLGISKPLPCSRTSGTISSSNNT